MKNVIMSNGEIYEIKQNYEIISAEKPKMIALVLGDSKPSDYDGGNLSYMIGQTIMFANRNKSKVEFVSWDQLNELASQNPSGYPEELGDVVRQMGADMSIFIQRSPYLPLGLSIEGIFRGLVNATGNNTYILTTEKSVEAIAKNISDLEQKSNISYKSVILRA